MTDGAERERENNQLLRMHIYGLILVAAGFAMILTHFLPEYEDTVWDGFIAMFHWIISRLR